jgi:hypothetical protein
MAWIPSQIIGKHAFVHGNLHFVYKLPHQNSLRQKSSARSAQLRLSLNFTETHWVNFRFLKILALIPALAWPSSDSKLMHPLAGGLVYPSFFKAGLTNPAALISDKGLAIQDLYQPRIMGQSSFINEAGISYSDGGFALGLGDTYGSVFGPASHTVFGGFAVKVLDLGLGLGFDRLISTGATTNINLGLQIGASNPLQYSIVLYRINATPQLALGVGYGKDNQYTVELSLLLPGFSTLSSTGSSYVLTAAVSGYAGNFGLSFATNLTYLVGQTGSGLLSSQSVNGIWWITRALSLNLGVNSGSALYLGSTLAF